uniref:Uncharacterized protein n=1 Tax=Medicago truncatula TaxID=3880 RepID=I3SFP9_MEDTR|nr:unknown [Medicago truncatula]
MKQKERTIWSILNVIHQSRKIQPFRLRVIVTVCLYRHASISPNVMVIGPGGNWYIDLGVGMKSLLKYGEKSTCTSPR